MDDVINSIKIQIAEINKKICDGVISFSDGYNAILNLESTARSMVIKFDSDSHGDNSGDR